MIVFVDTNILLDVLVRREPHYQNSARVWTLAERGEITTYISAISFNNIYYILRKIDGKTAANNALKLLRDVFESIPPDTRIINQAIDSECDDFEDAIQFHSAVRVGAQVLITRNPNDFPTSSITIASPDEFLKLWATR
ncbi:MAG: putative nucleic acid-binding protein [Candidatus Latescibacterota bacterium]|jgi:predicted nucleic acid-binding protein